MMIGNVFMQIIYTLFQLTGQLDCLGCEQAINTLCCIQTIKKLLNIGSYKMKNYHKQFDQIGRFIGLWASF